MILVKPEVEIIDMADYTDMIKKIEKIGRVCYKSEDRIQNDSAEKFIAGIIKRGHESVIEHESVSVKVICDRGVTHEIVRHRVASYSQESTRYCNYSKDKFQGQISLIDISTGFAYDMENPVDSLKYEIWHEAMENAEKSYFRMLYAGASPQEARSVLPNSLKTELVMTMNLREWRHFFKLRIADGAHPQMKEISKLILDVFRQKLPVFFQDIGEKSAKN